MNPINLDRLDPFVLDSIESVCLNYGFVIGLYFINRIKIDISVIFDCYNYLYVIKVNC